MLSGLQSIKFNLIKTLIYTSIFLITVFFFTVLIYSPFIPVNIHWKIGQIAPETVLAPYTIQYQSVIDNEKTKLLKQQRATTVNPVYSIDQNINTNIKRNLDKFFLILNTIKKENNLNNINKYDELDFLSTAKIKLLLQENIQVIQYITTQEIDKLLISGIDEIDYNFKNSIAHDLDKIDINNSIRIIIRQIILNFIQPNLFFDAEKTNLAIEEEINSVQPFETTIKKGQPIIFKGDDVDSDHIEILKLLNMYDAKISFIKLLGISLLIAILFFIIDRSIYYLTPRIYRTPKYLILIFMTIVSIIIIGLFLSIFPPIKGLGELKFLIPISIVSMITSLLITENLSLLFGLTTALLISITFRTDFFLFTYLSLSTIVTIFITHKTARRIDQVKSGYLIGLVNIFIIISIGLFNEIFNPTWYLINGLFGFINGLMCSMILIAIIPYIENFFNITTSQTLLENTNLNHPLLKQLMLAAPGTYQHSIMVANLSEAAAEAINADSILARTGGYFHDIGKLKRPLFFTENQFNLANPHENLSPRLSKIIIQSHVPEGIALATKYKLPHGIIDFISQHHGTALVSFFYNQAIKKETKEQTEEENIIEEDFRYEGPKPQTKEAGIIMLADSIEAAMRSLGKPTPSKIDNLVIKIINEKIADNQLDECPLSLKEIEIIEKTFLKVLKGAYHNRLSYQEELTKILENSTNINTSNHNEK